MRLTYEQCEWIRKQYIKFLDGKVTLEKINANIQKKFNVSLDFKEVITECKEINKGSYDIGWKFAEIE